MMSSVDPALWVVEGGLFGGVQLYYRVQNFGSGGAVEILAVEIRLDKIKHLFQIRLDDHW
jgi:hypothetical protein